MIRIATAAAALTLLLSACAEQSHGSGHPHAEPGVAGASTTTVRQDHGTTVKVYQAGKDIDPGVYTTTSVGCSAITTSTPDYDFAEPSDPDAFVAGSSRVGDVERIEVHQGEFFNVQGCGTWQREDGTRPRSPDPATVTGACTILMGDDALAETALTFAGRPLQGDDAYEIQEKLMAVVVARTKGLWRPAGQLVDLLDDPDAYVVGGMLSSRVSRAMTAVREVCGK